VPHEPDDSPLGSPDHKTIELINLESFKKENGPQKHEKYIQDAKTRENSG
jgi:hypothetical protein